MRIKFWATILVAWLCFAFTANAAEITVRKGESIWTACAKLAKIEKIKKARNGWINTCMHSTLEARGGKALVHPGEQIALHLPTPPVVRQGDRSQIAAARVAPVETAQALPPPVPVTKPTPDDTIPAALHRTMTAQLSGQLAKALDQRDTAAAQAISERNRADAGATEIRKLQTKVQELETRPIVAPTTSAEAQSAIVLLEQQLAASKKLADDRQLEIDRLKEEARQAGERAKIAEQQVTALRTEHAAEKVALIKRAERAESKVSEGEAKYAELDDLHKQANENFRFQMTRMATESAANARGIIEVRKDFDAYKLKHPAAVKGQAFTAQPKGVKLTPEQEATQDQCLALFNQGQSIGGQLKELRASLNPAPGTPPEEMGAFNKKVFDLGIILDKYPAESMKLQRAFFAGGASRQGGGAKTDQCPTPIRQTGHVVPGLNNDTGGANLLGQEHSVPWQPPPGVK